MVIAIDAMGGDNAPEKIIKGAINALKRDNAISLCLVGNQPVLENILNNLEYDQSRLKLVNASEVITMDDHPATAMRNKPDSSLAKAFDLVASGDADAVVSAGSTGAILAGAIFKLKRIKGISRPALAPFLPTAGGGRTLLLDVGANADCKPEYLAQFASMASEYIKVVYGKTNPSVGLVNIGTEDTKGNELTKAAFLLMKELPINFVGNVESRDVLSNKADILVTDGFTGNILLKFMEGMASTLFGELKTAFMSTTRSKIGAALSKPQLKQMKSQYDYEEIGAAVLLGVDGGVFKAHGASGEKAIENAIYQAVEFTKGDLIGKIKQSIQSNID